MTDDSMTVLFSEHLFSMTMTWWQFFCQIVYLSQQMTVWQFFETVCKSLQITLWQFFYILSLDENDSMTFFNLALSKLIIMIACSATGIFEVLIYLIDDNITVIIPQRRVLKLTVLVPLIWVALFRLFYWLSIFTPPTNRASF